MMKMKSYLMGTLLLFSSISLSKSFIIPQEVPSILSLIYSNIPPIRKGTDSRIGFGYRLGEHADFQVQFEIGPQKETKAIGSSTAKRNVKPSHLMEIEKKERVEKTKEDSKNNSWIQLWSEQMKQKPQVEKEHDLMNQQKISPELLQSLQQLYERQDDTETEKPSDEN